MISTIHLLFCLPWRGLLMLSLLLSMLGCMDALTQNRTIPVFDCMLTIDQLNVIYHLLNAYNMC